MAIKQLSVFVENKQGSLHDITEALAKANINLRSMSVADTSNYGIVRIIADKPDEAKALLDNDGQAANVRLVNAFAVPDVPGGLSQVLKLLEGNGVNIEYMYALITTEAGKAYSVMRTGDTEKTDEILVANGIELLDEAKLS
ncbi:MAG: ACT domain-containing protein [Clostridia bacterium]|nr:ACT domain-containing protein [Clostridia bacterium]